LIAFYNEVLKKQTTLKLLYQSSLLSIKALSEAKNEEDFEITLKQETYMLKEQFIIPEKLEAFLQEYE
jgi:hypothetical protein